MKYYTEIKLKILHFFNIYCVYYAYNKLRKHFKENYYKIFK